MRELSYATECQERFEPQFCIRMCIYQSVTYENSVFVMLENNFFFQQYASHTIKSRRNLVAVELTNVFMSFRIVIITIIFVKTKIKLSPMLYNGCIQWRQKDMIIVIQLRNGNN